MILSSSFILFILGKKYFTVSLILKYFLRQGKMLNKEFIKCWLIAKPLYLRCYQYILVVQCTPGESFPFFVLFIQTDHICFVFCQNNAGQIRLYSNYSETIIKYFVTYLDKHKHGIRGGHLVYWCRIQQGLHHKENTAANKQKIKAKLKEIPSSDSCITYKIF